MESDVTDVKYGKAASILDCHGVTGGKPETRVGGDECTQGENSIGQFVALRNAVPARLEAHSGVSRFSSAITASSASTIFAPSGPFS
jgi:hypothetical protein